MLTKALYGGKLIDVVEAKSCEEGTIFSCPICGGRVIAKMGPDRASHFAHFRVQDCGANDESVAEKFAGDPVASVKKMKL